MPDNVQELTLSGVVPVVVLNHAEQAVDLALAMQAGGLNSVEITMRTPAAAEAIRSIAAEVPGMTVGAGTVLNIQMAQDAVEAGAQFIVSPGLSKNLVLWCQERGIPVFPGVSTPTEITQAMELGLKQLKFFPAEQSGGVSMLKSLASPFQGIRFMPTGGISPKNLKDYLALPNVMACGGSWLCPQKLIDAGEFDQITVLCREAVQLAAG